MAQTAKPAQLNPRTLEAFAVYICQAEREMEQQTLQLEIDAKVDEWDLRPPACLMQNAQGKQ